LKPTLKILEYASDKTRASSLLCDLKLGVYHIDREQLRRNGLLNPRNPTIIREFTTKVEGAFQAKDVGASLHRIVAHLPPTATVYKIRCTVVLELSDVEEEAGNLDPYLLENGTLADVYREEWVVYRSMKDFQALHKQLKAQVNNTETSASAGSRLVGAATAAFSAGTLGRKQKKALIPSLAQASKTGALAVTKKSIVKRGELLDGYLEYLLSPNHALSRCSEILLFLGALYPFPDEVRVMHTPINMVDPLDRVNLVRSVASDSVAQATPASVGVDRKIQSPTKQRIRKDSVGSSRSLDVAETNTSEASESEDNALDTVNDDELIQSVLNKVDQVTLAEVRNRVVELVRYQFGFENASFFRSRMLSALETASFVAVTKGSSFRKMLYDLHIQHLNSGSVADWIKVVLDLLWPDGVWMTYAPPLTEEEEKKLAETSREKLHAGFPEQIRSILGQELTGDGLDMVHEMFQNRLVVKSLFYMLFDLLWIEIFPELRDVLTCASALDIE
jgi:hypothetical protein